MMSQQERVDEVRRRILEISGKEVAAGQAVVTSVRSDAVIQAVAKMIPQDQAKRGPSALHHKLLLGTPSAVVAAVAYRAASRILLAGETGMRTVAKAVGRAVHGEVMLRAAEHIEPRDFASMVAELGRRRSLDEEHRVRRVRTEFALRGNPLPDWPRGAQDGVGVYLLGRLAEAGLCDIKVTHGSKETLGVVTPRPWLAEDCGKGILMRSLRAYPGGMQAQPLRPWASPHDGGYDDRAAKLSSKSCLLMGRGREANVPERILRVVNNLQAQPHVVDPEMVRVLQAVIQANLSGELATEANIPAMPEKLHWMTHRQAESPDEEMALREWKYAARDTWEARALFHSRHMMTRRILSESGMAGREGYFLHQLDSRGRVYCDAWGYHPQGSDAQRAVLRAANTTIASTEDAVKWLHVGGANRYGFDNGRLTERYDWIRERYDWIRAIAKDPIGTGNEWKDCDNPLQFVAWCKEFSSWLNDSKTPLGLHVSMDGTCNGLQHLSALLRDEAGGEAVNLRAVQPKQDIYMRVVDKARPLFRLQGGLGEIWAKVLDRTHGKKVTMPLPYGASQLAHREVARDWLRKNPGHFPKDRLSEAATLFGEVMRDAAEQVLTGAMQALAWLRRVGAHAVANQGVSVKWVVPGGFQASQTYARHKIIRVDTYLMGKMRLGVRVEDDKPDSGKHVRSFPANFVHSLDAAHLHFVAERAFAGGLPYLRLVHDDYGTLPSHTEALYRIVREEFLRLYTEQDPLHLLLQSVPGAPDPPESGKLDLREVLQSEYLFS